MGVETIRRISKKFVLIFFSELLILGFILYLGFSEIDEPSEQVKNTGSILASFIIVFLTTALVYNNFYQMSEIKFMGFTINPLVTNENSGNYETIAKTDFLEHNTHKVRSDVYSIKFPLYIKKVECKERPRLFSVENTITNLGFVNANINEIRYYMIYPKQARSIVNDGVISLSHQETDTISLYIPVDRKIWNYTFKGGKIILKFEVVGATGKTEKQVWIRISDDLKLIEWSESKLRILLTRVF